MRGAWYGRSLFLRRVALRVGWPWSFLRETLRITSGCFAALLCFCIFCALNLQLRYSFLGLSLCQEAFADPGKSGDLGVGCVAIVSSKRDQRLWGGIDWPQLGQRDSTRSLSKMRSTPRHRVRKSYAQAVLCCWNMLKPVLANESQSMDSWNFEHMCTCATSFVEFGSDLFQSNRRIEVRSAGCWDSQPFLGRQHGQENRNRLMCPDRNTCWRFVCPEILVARDWANVPKCCRLCTFYTECRCFTGNVQQDASSSIWVRA